MTTRGNGPSPDPEVPVDKALWCVDCQTSMPNTTSAYLKHSIATHKGGGWRGIAVPADTVPKPKETP